MGIQVQISEELENTFCTSLTKLAKLIFFVYIKLHVLVIDQQCNYKLQLATYESKLIN